MPPAPQYLVVGGTPEFRRSSSSPTPGVFFKLHHERSSRPAKKTPTRGAIRHRPSLSVLSQLSVQGPHPALGRAAVPSRGHGAASARVAADDALPPGAGAPAPARPRWSGRSAVRRGPCRRTQRESMRLRVGGSSDLPRRRRARTLAATHRAGAGASAVVVAVGGGGVHRVPALPSRVGPTDRRQAGVAAHALRDRPRPGRRDPVGRHHAPSNSRFPAPTTDTGRRHTPDLRDDRNRRLGVAATNHRCRSTYAVSSRGQFSVSPARGSV